MNHDRWETLKRKVISDNIKDSMVNVVDKMNIVDQLGNQTDNPYPFDVEVKQNTHGRTPDVDDIQEMCLWANSKFDDGNWVWRGWVSYNTESITAFAFANSEDAVLFSLRWV